jgi:UDP-N-acetylmuramoyl-tripeptide--D-alanyl-D-alanine ligase
MQELFDLFYATSGVCTDTRKIEKDSLFICLKGANFNGNTFAQQALKEEELIEERWNQYDDEVHDDNYFEDYDNYYD